MPETPAQRRRRIAVEQMLERNQQAADIDAHAVATFMAMRNVWQSLTDEQRAAEIAKELNS